MPEPLRLAGLLLVVKAVVMPWAMLRSARIIGVTREHSARVNPAVELIGAAGLTLLASCGSAPEEEAAGTADTTDPTDGALIVEHVYGTTEISEPPERVVSLDWQWTDVLTALGQPPVGGAGQGRAQPVPRAVGPKTNGDDLDGSGRPDRHGLGHLAGEDRGRLGPEHAVLPLLLIGRAQVQDQFGTAVRRDPLNRRKLGRIIDGAVAVRA